MGKFNLYLDETLAEAARAVAEKNPKYRSLSGMVTSLITSHLKTNVERVKRACAEAKIPFPADFLAPETTSVLAASKALSASKAKK